MRAHPRWIADDERKSAVRSDIGEVGGKAERERATQFECALLGVEFALPELEILLGVRVTQRLAEKQINDILRPAWLPTDDRRVS